jgi:hypothetical protein
MKRFTDALCSKWEQQEEEEDIVVICIIVYNVLHLMVEIDRNISCIRPYLRNKVCVIVRVTLEITGRMQKCKIL